MRRLTVGLLVALVATLGAASSAAGATKPPGYQFLYTSFFAPQSSFTTMHQTNCPTGTVTWGGGILPISGTIPMTIASSYWNGATPGAWVGVVGNTNSSTADDEIYAMCADKPSGYKLVSKTVDDPAGAITSGTVKCAVGSVLLSGGLATTADVTSVYEMEAAPTSSRAFKGAQANQSGMDQPFHLYALCAAKPAGYVRVTKSVSVPTGTNGGVTLNCPTGTVILDGGALVSALVAGKEFLVTSGPREVPPPYGWVTNLNNVTGQTITETTSAICAA